MDISIGATLSRNVGPTIGHHQGGRTDRVLQGIGNLCNIQVVQSANTTTTQQQRTQVSGGRCLVEKTKKIEAKPLMTSVNAEWC